MPSSVTPKQLAISAAFILCTLLALLGLLVFAVPIQEWSAPRSAARGYQNESLALIIEDLERNDVLPKGTVWEDPELKNHRVSVGWFLSRDRAVLEKIAIAAGVVIRFPTGYHGEVWGPISIARATKHTPAGVEPQHRGDMPYSGVR